MKFAMYGSGAAGSVFASYLRNGGADIILIDRYEAHMKKVAEEGMQVDEAAFKQLMQEQKVRAREAR